eukprot:13773178-Alexandrium_andersonii.AAC.1
MSASLVGSEMCIRDRDRLARVRAFRKADCGLRRIAALAGVEQLAGCTVDPLQSQGPSDGSSERASEESPERLERF